MYTKMERLTSDAFYTSRVDDEGNEIEIIHTARTVEMPQRTTRSNISSRESSRSVQYVNPAVCIEKNAEDSISLPSLANSDIVPPLDLQSEECYPTRREGYTFSYRNHYEPVKLDANPDVAYNNWLSAKRKIISDDAVRRKQEKEAKIRQQEERRRQAEEKYQKWLQSKQQSRTKQNYKEQDKRIKGKPNADELAARAKLEEWERKKREQEEHRREMKRREDEKRKREEEKRRQLAEEAWKKWIATAPYKPKPVPLNQGMDTLRGTVSSIFINPNEWRTD